MVRVSVIIPTFNAEKYILEAIYSAFLQTYKDFEIIVVDDGSTDNTQAIIKNAFENKNTENILTILKRPNGGTAAALNTGIKFARGDFIHWLSADDVLYPDALEKMMKTVEAHPNKENVIFYSNYDFIDESSNRTGQIFLEPNYNADQEKLKKELWDHHIGNGSTSIIHKSIFDAIGPFDEKLKYCEDYEFWLRAVFCGRLSLHLVPEITLHYRLHSDQITKILGDKAGPFIKRCREKTWLKMTDQQRMIYDEPR